MKYRIKPTLIPNEVFVKKVGALDTIFARTVDSKNSILKQHVV